MWPTAGSTYFGYVLPKMKNNARNVMYLFVQSERGRRDMHTSSIPNWTKLAKVRAISQVPPFVFFKCKKRVSALCTCPHTYRVTLMINAFWRILFVLTCPKKCVQLSSFKCWWCPWRHMRECRKKEVGLWSKSVHFYMVCGASRENINVKSYDLLRPWCQEHNSSLTFFKAQTMCHLGRVLLDHQCLFRRWTT